MGEGEQADELIVCAAYSEADDSYRTSAVAPTSLDEGRTESKSAQIANSNTQTGSSHQRSFSAPTSRANKARPGARLISSSTRTTDCLSGCLLGAALLASILNTFLLSFVIKSIQLNNVSKRLECTSIGPVE